MSATIRPPEPPHCARAVAAFHSRDFDLAGEAPESGEARPALAELGKWLGARLDTLLFDGARSVCLKKPPLAPDGETDLGALCHFAMRRLRNDRCHAAPQLRFEFGFSGNSAA